MGNVLSVNLLEALIHAIQEVDSCNRLILGYDRKQYHIYVEKGSNQQMLIQSSDIDTAIVGAVQKWLAITAKEKSAREKLVSTYERFMNR